MSYHTWTTYGFGFCVDDIYKDNTLSVEKFLKLAAIVPSVLEDVRDYMDGICDDEGITYDEFTIDDFDDMEGDYCERGLAYILLHVIEKELPVIFADDFNGTQYILYCASYPWNMTTEEKSWTKEDIIQIFKKYISILTDVQINIDSYSVENGG